MKYRTDFVTNSSSSSFIIIGITLDAMEKYNFPINNISYKTVENLLNVIDREELDICIQTTDCEYDNCSTYLTFDNVDKKLEKHNIEELKNMYKEYILKYFNIYILIDDIEFEYGAYRNG